LQDVCTELVLNDSAESYLTPLSIDVLRPLLGRVEKLEVVRFRSLDLTNNVRVSSEVAVAVASTDVTCTVRITMLFAAVFSSHATF
jgi:hypothetical protein